jgi:hypothetical protein
MIIYQNYAGNKQKSYKITKMQMFTTLDKANCDTGNIRGLNLAAVRHMTIQEAVVAGATNDRAMICCTEPELTEALYIFYIHTHLINCKM